MTDSLPDGARHVKSSDTRSDGPPIVDVMDRGGRDRDHVRGETTGRVPGDRVHPDGTGRVGPDIPPPHIDLLDGQVVLEPDDLGRVTVPEVLAQDGAVLVHVERVWQSSQFGP